MNNKQFPSLLEQFHIFVVKEMKSKAVERLTSVTLDTDDSESEPEIIDAKELNTYNESTGLRRRNVGESESIKSDAEIFIRSIFKVEEMETFDEEVVEEDQEEKEDEEEVETGSVSNTIYNL